MLKSTAMQALILFIVTLLVTVLVQVKRMPELVIETTKSDLLQRQEVNTIGYTDVMFDHTIDPRSEGFTAPQNDTLYASAWLDLSEEPLVLIQGVVDNHRYYVHEFVNTRNEVTAYITGATDGNQGGHYLLVGPDFTGTPPESITRVVQMSTNEVWDLYRIYSSDQADFERADSQRRDIQLVKLSDYMWPE